MQTNYERIKNMTLEEMADFINRDEVCDNKLECDRNCPKCVVEYLKREVSQCN